MTEGDPGFAQIIGGHLDVDFGPHADADEVFAHFSGDMREHFVPVGEGDSEHGSRQDLRHCAGQFNGFFFCQAIIKLDRNSKESPSALNDGF